MSQLLDFIQRALDEQWNCVLLEHAQHREHRYGRRCASARGELNSGYIRVLGKRFGMATKEHGNDSRIIVVEVEGHVLGFIVDGVKEVLRIDSSIVDPAPTMTTSIDSDYIDGVGKLDDRLLILLNLSRLFDAEQLKQMTQMAENRRDQ